MEFNFGTNNIVELGTLITNDLKRYGIKEKAELTIYLGEEEFKKVDEDLFYRNRTDENEKFIPSDGETIINFEGVKILIIEKESADE